jgi:hypothetical protein
MNRLFLQLVLPFAVAMPAGLVLGGMSGEKEPVPPAHPTRVAERGSGKASRPTATGLDELLQRYEADELAREESDAEPFLDWVADWTEAELEAALTEALRLPRCMDPLGRDHRLLWQLYRAWIHRNPEAAAAWIDTIPSSTMRDALVRNACECRPADRAMDGIDFLLKHHWRAGRSYPDRLFEHALESQAAHGSAAVDELLRRLADAKVGVTVESLDFPAGFDFAWLVNGVGFATQEKESFKDQILKEWRLTDPGSMLAWMDRSAHWEPFQSFLVEGAPETARFWDAADAKTRTAALDAIRWRELGQDWLDRFAGQVNDPEGKLALVTEYFRSGASDDRVAVLELIPSAQARVGVLTSLHPDIDWRADSPPTAGEPAWVAAVRDAMVDWKVVVPAPPPDPFGADPFSSP